MSETRDGFDPTIPKPKGDRHMPHGTEVVCNENPRVVEEILRGKIVKETFYGQTWVYIPNIIADIIGDQNILEMARIIYGDDAYENKDRTPIKIHRETNSRFVDLPRCPVIIDDQEKQIAHFDTTLLDRFIDSLMKKFEELSPKT